MLIDKICDEFCVKDASLSFFFIKSPHLLSQFSLRIAIEAKNLYNCVKSKHGIVAMDSKEKDINNMKCWVFRIAQTAWHKTPGECMSIFINNKLFDYINNTYDYLHLSGYKLVLRELEEILAEKGIGINA